MSVEISEKEQAFLKRQIRSADRYLYFCGAGIAAAVVILVLTVFHSPFDAARFILAVVLLLHARGNLKQHKDAKLLRKLSGELGLA